MVKEKGLSKHYLISEKGRLELTYQGMEQGSTKGNTCSNLAFPAALAAASVITRSASLSVWHESVLFAFYCNTHFNPRFLQVLTVTHEGFTPKCIHHHNQELEFWELSKQKGFWSKRQIEREGMMRFTHYLDSSTFGNSRTAESSTCKCS
jgi:hypothetical protein